MAKSVKVLDVIEKVVVYVTYVLVSLMVINTSMGVFFRFILNNALSWTDELGRYMMIWVGFFGCYLAARDNSHVGVQMFVDLFKPSAQKVFHVAARLVVIVFLFLGDSDGHPLQRGDLRHLHDAHREPGALIQALQGASRAGARRDRKQREIGRTACGLQ
jgi:hypothetical protein